MNTDRENIRICNREILKHSLILTGSSVVGFIGISGIVNSSIEGSLDMGLFSLYLATSLVSFGVAYTSAYTIHDYVKCKKRIRKK